eukprot:6926345-Prorocentrum_lima.AAC.1
MGPRRRHRARGSCPPYGHGPGRNVVPWLTSVNVTSWGSLRKCLGSVFTDLVAIQEHKLSPAYVAEVSASVKKDGMHLPAIPAVRKNS